MSGLSRFFEISQLEQQWGQRGKPYMEFLRVSAMSAGLHVLPAGGTDPQRPHNEDEMYYVVRRQARMRLGSEDQVVSDGRVIFVKQELVVLVGLAPAES